MGCRHPAQAFDDPVRLTLMSGTQRVSIFPLPGAVLYPGLQLPLHIFEPRYRALIGDALARDRRIGMIQPKQAQEGAPLFAIGCLGPVRLAELRAIFCEQALAVGG